MEIIGLLAFLALIVLTAYTVHIARGGDGEPFIGPRPAPHRRTGRFLPASFRRR
ncbi:hypothetical protein ACFQ36_08860 [Arthrobacter sp. GCM10027362]|uniref:hypothetical protein n=1 Tax=Arthrobacter sp. GCM10027362 TaxID=3273379 RepID=UPI00362BB03F